MKIIKILFIDDDGGQLSTTGAKEIKDILSKVDISGLEHTSDIKTLHNKYFAMLSELCKNTSTGYTKSDLHEALKPLVMKPLYDIDIFFAEDTDRASTRGLTYEGWVAAIAQLKTVANDVFGYSF